MIGIATLAVIGVAALLWQRGANARVMRELREQPGGERARKVMLLTLPSGKQLPMNYLREGQKLYAGADFPWWRELRGDGGRVTALVRGEELSGHARAVEDDPARRKDVFSRLRPSAVEWWGVLVEIDLDP